MTKIKNTDSKYVGVNDRRWVMKEGLTVPVLGHCSWAGPNPDAMLCWMGEKKGKRVEREGRRG